MVNVKILEYGNAAHISQVLTGFIDLAKQKAIYLTFNLHENEIKLPSFGSALLLADIDGKLCAFDTLDGYNLDMIELDDFLGKIDFYFKRSFLDEKNKKLLNGKKIYELGLNYFVTTKDYPIKLITTLSQKLKHLIKVVAGLDYWTYGEKVFEMSPSYETNKEPKIIFLTRLWSPEGEPGERGQQFSNEYKKERMRINKMRITLIKRLQEVYKHNFIGGLYDTEYARKIAPELIVSKVYASKKKYLRKVKSVDICIGSEGLHGSTGWKTAEYVAASKAIVVETMMYSAPFFTNGKNYYSFDTVDECMQILETLNNNRNLIKEMQIVNNKYYLNFLRPDKLINNCLLKITNN